MTDSVERIDIAMKVPPLNMGELIPPDSLVKPVLYSHVKATQEFNALDRDVYQTVKRTTPGNKKKTPKSVFWGLGAAIVAGLLILKKLKK
ncbi:MAG: hypothetical protein LBJ74_04825 [Heliobacteriaceae bacterium]|jgi:hypothetical protein|nr:hypothetical protein [Heliobacteriaceae bacterium]